MNRKLIKLTENELREAVRNAVKESFTTVSLQLIKGNFWPTDSISRDIVKKQLDTDMIPEEKIDYVLPKLVKNGYKIAFFDYESPKIIDNTNQLPVKLSKTTSLIKNPCPKCGLKNFCDSDDCGKKNFRLFSNTKKNAAIF